jgi:mannose-1-phosphate guanylyltransferase
VNDLVVKKKLSFRIANIFRNKRLMELDISSEKRSKARKFMKQNQLIEFPFSSGFGNKKSDRFAVILAGGEGSRLKSLTRWIMGDERPKQFCSILDNKTLLDVTRRRTALKIESENTFYSLTKKHERFYSSLLSDGSKNQLIVQPENKGTAPAILYSLMKLPREATVAFFPSDHYISDDLAFMNNVEKAFRAVDFHQNSIVLLGIEPEKAETSYGWIEPVKSLFGNSAKSVTQVKRFWEKPSSESAEYLMKKGCLWNSFVMVGKVATFLNLFRKYLPDLYRMFEAANSTFGTSKEISTVRSIYDWINETNFSGEILEKCVDELYVLRVGDVVWSDLGEPQRVLQTIETLGVQMDWMQAVAA